ncbi:MAG TPA: rod-binding protein [Nitrospira sp.]|nr:rod-binding protein [Nitrospira sp.]
MVSPAAAPGPAAGTFVQPDAARIREAAQEFEGYFISYLLKTMRETVHTGLVKNEAGQMFYSFYDQEIGRVSARAGGFGLGAMVEMYIEQQQGWMGKTGLKFSSPPSDNGSGEAKSHEAPRPGDMKTDQGRT